MYNNNTLTFNYRPTNPNTKMEILQCALERVNGAIWDLLEMYCKVFHVDFSVLPSTPASRNEDCGRIMLISFGYEVTGAIKAAEGEIHGRAPSRVPTNHQKILLFIQLCFFLFFRAPIFNLMGSFECDGEVQVSQTVITSNILP